MLLLVTGCATGPPATAEPSNPLVTFTPGGTPASTTVHDRAAGFEFDRPESWAVWQPNQHAPTTGGPLLYLSTDPLLPACAVAPSASPNPADANGAACEWPLNELQPGGVLAMWETTRILQPLPTDGPVVQTNGAEARWKVSTPGACAAVGADETVTVAVPIGQPSPLSNIVFVACLRGPDLSSSEGEIRALLETARLAP